MPERDKERLYNFNPGPAVLPEPVLLRVRESIISYQETGIGILEMSHRGGAFQTILHETESNLRGLLNINVGYSILFTTGGATNQFSMLPMNLLREGSAADYVLTGWWSEKALEEASKFGQTAIAASSRDAQYRYIPETCELSPHSAYLHFTSNNTMYGTQFHQEPELPPGAVLACDASSDFLSRPLNITRYGVIYAGAQKNAGPAGVTIVVIRDDLMEQAPATLPIMMRYSTYAESASLYNTPPVFAIYVVGEVLKWIKETGGLAALHQRNQQKAAVLYDAIDTSEFYIGHAEKEARSLMNVTFRLRREDLDAKFAQEAAAVGLHGLKGHRNVGGLRASIYNAFPPEGVVRLVEFMQEFEKRNG